MTYFSTLKTDAKVPDVMARFPNTTKPLIEYHEALLRGEDSPFTVAERETMAAFVSSLNHCGYWVGAHAAVAVEFGASQESMDSLMAGLETADIDDKMRPVYAFIKKLTLTPAQMTQADADRVYAAGWDERALHDAIEVCALFNFMNRYVEGHGLKAIAGGFAKEGKMLKGGYKPLLKVLGLE